MSDEEKKRFSDDPLPERPIKQEVSNLRKDIVSLSEKLRGLENRITIEQHDLTHESRYIQDKTSDLRATLAKWIQEITKDLDEIKLWINGDNVRDDIGANARLIIIEEKEKRREKFWENIRWGIFGSLAVGASLAILALIFDVWKPEITYLMKHWYTNRPVHAVRNHRRS